MHTTVAPAIQEEYYQINSTILTSFPKYRFPLDLFIYNNKIQQLTPYYTKETRLTNEQVEEVHRLCAEGDLFVSRADHPVYSQHIAKQLDLVLVDKHLKETEVTDICLQALHTRLQDFFEQPVKPVFDRLYADLMVVTEFLWSDLHRFKLFMRRLHRKQYSLIFHSINTLIIGLWLYSESNKDLKRANFNHAALGLLLHDAGMAKIPVFILQKTQPLKPEEKEKIPSHVLTGCKILHKLELNYDLISQAALEHHERLDGSGYPQKTNEISAFGRLTAVADSFSAMLQKRPYSDAKSPLDAARELCSETVRFDKAYTNMLLAAFAANAFGMLPE